jgi:hypothetical protein
MKRIARLILPLLAVMISVANTQAGRWLSRDPIEDGAGFVQRDPFPQRRILSNRNEPNLYGFVKNNSINHVDPDGRMIWFPLILTGILLSGCSSQQCCEYVTSVSYTSSEIPLGSDGLYVGHRIKYSITVQYQKCAKGGTASMQFLETTDNVPNWLSEMGKRPNVESDTYGTMISNNKIPSGFYTWYYRNAGKSIPCSGTKIITVTDEPSIQAIQFIPDNRITSSRMVFKNPSGCMPATVSSKTWTQYLNWDGSRVEKQKLEPPNSN